MFGGIESTSFKIKWAHLERRGKAICKKLFGDPQKLTKITNEDKLYVIVREDLKPGAQACQGMHSAIVFQQEHSELAKKWYVESNSIVFLSIKNEEELNKLLDQVKEKGIVHSIFREPDFHNELTSITLAPGIETRKICSQLKLALK
jgi:peptidyl-tRNA hydrolase